MYDIIKLTGLASALSFVCGVMYNVSYFSLIDHNSLSLLSIHDHTNTSIPLALILIPLVLIAKFTEIFTALQSDDLLRTAISYSLPIVGKRRRKQLLDIAEKYHAKDAHLVNDPPKNEHSNQALPKEKTAEIFLEAAQMMGFAYIAIFIGPILIYFFALIPTFITKLMALFLALIWFVFIGNALLPPIKSRNALIVRALAPSAISFTVLFGLLNGEADYHLSTNTATIFVKDLKSEIQINLLRIIDSGVIGRDQQNVRRSTILGIR